MQFIDTHAHLDTDEFATDRDEVLARARAAGIGHIVCVGAGGDLATCERTVAYAERTPGMSATVGIHPHEANAIGEIDFDQLEALARREVVVAVGETGLDYHYNLSTHENQQRGFARFIELGRRVRKPIVCHIRDAHADATALLIEGGASEVGGVIHCFTGGPEDARRYLDLGFYISFSGILTFRNADEIRAAAAIVPHDRVLLETDCPYLAPLPLRGKRNEPAFLVHTAAVLAASMGLPIDRVGELTTENASRLFALTSPAPAGIDSPSR